MPAYYEWSRLMFLFPPDTADPPPERELRPAFVPRREQIYILFTSKYDFDC